MCETKSVESGNEQSRYLMFSFKISKDQSAGNDCENKSCIVDDSDRFTCQKY